MFVPLTWFGVLGAAAMAVFLLAVRYAGWDLIPDSALPRVLWWRRRAPLLLTVSAAVAAAGGLALVWTP